MPQFIDFDHAVMLAHKVEDYWNSPDSDQEILFLAEKFNLQIRDGFVVSTKEIRRNCPDCMGCHNSVCTLGCFDSDKNVVCLWDIALEEVIGTKLIMHEYGHVIYDQIFMNNLSEIAEFEQSEEFAQYIEENYTIAFEFCEGCSEDRIQAKIMRKGGGSFHIPTIEAITGMSADEMRSEAFHGLIAGFSLAIGGAIFAVLLNKAFGEDRAKILG